MPAIITHYLFGEKSLELLPEGIITNAEERQAFLVANQGPDPLFFRWRGVLTNTSACMKMGSRLHHERMSTTLSWLRDGVSRLPVADTNLGRAYALGMLSHYALDRTAHPYIYAHEYEIIDVGTGMDDAEGEVHAIEEADIDVAMLWRTHHQTTAEREPWTFVEHTPRTAQVAGALVSHMVVGSFGQEFGPNYYAESLADMLLLYKIIEPAGSVKAELVGLLERQVKPHSLVQSLAHKTSVEGTEFWMNDQHLSWTDPFSGTVSNESFEDVFERALAGWPALVEGFISGQDTNELTGHLDYSGCKLDSDESRMPDDYPLVRPYKKQ